MRQFMKGPITLCLLFGGAILLLVWARSPHQEIRSNRESLPTVGPDGDRGSAEPPLALPDEMSRRSLVENPSADIERVPSIQAPRSQLLPWAEAKPLTRSSVEPTEAHLDDFQSDALVVSFHFGDPQEPLLVEVPLDECGSQALLPRLKREGVQVPELAAITLHEVDRLQQECSALLEPMAAEAREQLVRSQHEYWRLEMFQRTPANGDPLQPPPRPVARQRGIYFARYPGLGGGWKVFVAFDSADFPELEWTLREMVTLKNEFASRVQRLMGFHG